MSTQPVRLSTLASESTKSKAVSEQHQIQKQAKPASTQPSKSTRKPTTQKPTATDKALSILHSGVANLLSQDGWKKALAFKTKFYHYSFFNTALIYTQKPEATYVAGYSKWQSLGRQVTKGEKGICILAPIIRKLKAKELQERREQGTNIPANPDEPVLVGFRAVHVFDVTQTKGEPIPQIERPKLLEGKEEDTDLISLSLCKLLSFSAQNQLNVSFDLQDTSALGTYEPLAKRISLQADLPPLQKLKTLVHKLAHALLHDLSSQRDIAELEAESCAYLVCDSLGLDTSSYSFAYLAHWTPDLDSLMTAGERASKAAERITAALEPADADSGSDNSDEEATADLEAKDEANREELTKAA